MKTILLSILILSTLCSTGVNAGVAPPEGENCKAFNKVYQDALKNFTEHRGEKKTIAGLFGETTYWEYNIVFWDAESAELFPSMFSTANVVDFRYCTTGSLEEANRCQADLQKKVEACFPVNYYVDYGEPDDDGMAYVNITDKRDGNPEEDLIFTHIFPHVTIEVVKEGTNYYVEFSFIAGEVF